MKKLFISLLGILCIGMFISPAQTLNSGYFLDNYNFGHTINPAYQPEKETDAFFGLVIGNSVVNSMANVGASAFLYPVDGSLVFGLNKKVPAEQFLGNLKPTNEIKANLNGNILNFGIRTSEKGFFTFDCGLKAIADFSIPKSFFEMLKRGVKDNDKYIIKDIDGWFGSYLECALGYSQKIGDKIDVGGRIKLLVGLGQAETYINNMSVYFGTDKKVHSSGEGHMAVACPAVSVSKTQEGNIDLKSFKFGGFGVSGWGYGVDLGITYRPIEDLAIDFAVQNLGSITWKKNINGTMNYQDKILSSGSDIKIQDIFVFNQKDNEKISTGIPTTFRVGAKYKMPFYRNLSVRALGTMVTGNHYKCNDFRIGATVTPVKQISATVNYGYTTYGNTMGAAVNFNLGFFNLFLGADSIINRITPQALPINPYYITVNGGITIQVKKKK